MNGTKSSPAQDHIESFLMSDSFYNGRDNSNHVSHFQSLVDIPKSTSSISVEVSKFKPDGDHQTSEQQKTSFMRNSPSMRALEIKLEKSVSMMGLNFQNIDEEEEDQAEVSNDNVVAAVSSLETGDMRSGVSSPGKRDSYSRGTFVEEEFTERMQRTGSPSSMSTSISTPREPIDSRRDERLHYYPIKDIFQANRKSISQITVSATDAMGKSKSATENTPEINAAGKDLTESNQTPREVIAKQSEALKREDVAYKPLKLKSMIPDTITNEYNGKASLQGAQKGKILNVKVRGKNSIDKNKEQPPLPSQMPKKEKNSKESAGTLPGDKKSKRRFSFMGFLRTKTKSNITKDEPSIPKPLKTKSFSSPNLTTIGKSKTSEKRNYFGSKDKIKNKSENEKYKSRKESRPNINIPEVERETHYEDLMNSLEDVDEFNTEEDTDMLIGEEDKQEIKSDTNEKGNKIKGNFLNDSPKTKEMKDKDTGTPKIEAGLYRDAELSTPRDNSSGKIMSPSSADSGYDILLNEDINLSPFRVNYPQERSNAQGTSYEGGTLQRQSNLKLKSEQLLGEALFPKSLSQTEIESIVSLERSMSTRSIKSTKRNSFINYDGTSNNVIQYDATTQSPRMPNVKRSGSILKNAAEAQVEQKGSEANVEAEYAQSPDVIQTPKVTNEVFTDSTFQDLIEFSDYLDVENLDFSLSPQSLSELSPRIAAHSSPRESISSISKNYKDTTENQSSSSERNELLQSESDDSSVRIIAIEYADKPSGKAEKILEPSPDLLITPPRSQTDEDKQNNKPDESLQHEEGVFEKVRDPKSAIETCTPDSPESLVENSQIPRSLYLNPVQDDNVGKIKDRPVSMSFKGFKNLPTFDNKVSKKELRTSDSHQSFNISLDDDELEIVSNGFTEDEVGAGFGSSQEEDDSSIENEDFESYQYDNAYTRNINSLSPDMDAEFFEFTENSWSPQINTNTSKTKFDSPNLKNDSLNIIHQKVKNKIGIPRKQAKKPSVKFSSRIILYETYNGEEYDRHPDFATCNQLTPLLAQQIREELNNLKREMDVHIESECYTQFL